jgi:methyl-accepting chemotaxis protein
LFEKPVTELAPLRATQAKLQDEVSALARTDSAAAIALLNAKETPAWRALRASLLTNIDGARKAAGIAHADTEQRADRVEAIAAVLALMAIAVSAALSWVMIRTLHHELGADPAEVRTALREVAAGNLVAVSASNHQTRGLMVELEHMQSSLRLLVVQVRDASVSITHASDEIAQGNNDLSARTEQQASALEETSATMEELNTTVRQNAENAGTANTLAVDARKIATHGGEVMVEVVRTMKGINDSSRKIADIISVIDGIAFQTNILALNAAVEAARAGEQGRGFAVVASEVRSLAGRSAEAAREIKELIGASVERVEAGSTLVDRAGATMSEVVQAIGRVTDIVGEISAASREQSQGVAQAGEAITQMDQATQQNAALVEESAAAASSMRSQAHDLVQALAKFQVGDTASSAPVRVQGH